MVMAEKVSDVTSAEIKELAKRVGIGEYFDKTVGEWIDVRLDTKFPLIANIEPTAEIVRTIKPVYNFKAE